MIELGQVFLFALLFALVGSWIIDRIRGEI